MRWTKRASCAITLLVSLLQLQLLQVVNAKRQLGTNALLSCMENSQFQAKSFSVIFDPDSGIANITASAISSIEGNFTANIQLIAYGIKAINVDVNSCSVSQTLCPIQAGHFEVDTSFELGKDIVKDIPGIAYTMPDLDGIVRVRVYQLNADGTKVTEPIACLEADVQNGKTVQTKWASWGLFIAIIIGILVAGVVSMLGHVSTASHISANIVSLFTYFQSVSVIGMMAVHRLPPIAAAWVQNFMWTMGIIETEFMQKIFTWYIRSTGGTPTNILPNKNIISIAIYRHKKRAMDAATAVMERVALWAGVDLYRNVTSVARDTMPLTTRLLRRVDMNNNYTTTNEKDPSLVNKTLILRGIKRVAFKANIELTNMFLTGATFFTFIGLLIVLILAGIKYGLELLVKMGAIHKDSFTGYRTQWQGYTRGVLYRYFLISFTMLSVLCLWEFTNASSVATVITAVIIYIVVAACLLYATVKVFLLARKSLNMFENPAYILYGNNEILNRWGFLYVQFRATHYWFLMPLLIYVFIKSAVIAFGQSSGKAQAVIIFVVEIAYLTMLAWFKPYMDKKTNAFNIGISVICLLNSILFLFFSQLFGEKADVAASICGVVFFILNAVLSLVLLIIIIIACIWALVRREPDSRYQPMRDDRDFFMADSREKVENNELEALGNTARDGYRESFIHYTHDNSSWAEDSRSRSLADDGPEPAATRYDSSTSFLNNEYPSYQQSQPPSRGMSQSYGYSDSNSDFLYDSQRTRYPGPR